MKKRFFAVLTATVMLVSCFSIDVKAVERVTDISPTESTAIAGEVSPIPDPLVNNIWMEMTESIREAGYFYKEEIAPEDEDIEINGFSWYLGHQDYFKVTLADSDDGDLSVLSVDEDFEIDFRINPMLRDQTKDGTEEVVDVNDIESTEVTLSLSYSWRNTEKLRFVIYIEYGNNSRIIYAEDFAVYNPRRLSLNIEQAEVHVPTFSGKFFSGFVEGNLFDSEELVCSLNVGDAIDIVVPFRITEAQEAHDDTDDAIDGAMLTPDGWVSRPTPSGSDTSIDPDPLYDDADKYKYNGTGSGEELRRERERQQMEMEDRDPRQQDITVGPGR